MADFLQAIDYVARHEGAYSNDRDDRGGATHFGITQRTLDDFNRRYPNAGFPKSVDGLTPIQSKSILEIDYWRFGEVTDQRVATKLFDMAVNMGIKTAVRLAQIGLNSTPYGGLTEDGILGPKTLAAINRYPPGEMLKDLCRLSEFHYRSIVKHDPTQRVFLKGWLKRAMKVPDA